MARPLNPMQLRFVAEYLKCGVGSQAALAAGYKKSGASAAASALLQNPLVRAELERVRSSVLEEAKYNYARAMGECDEGIAFARETENAAAMAKFVELKTKLSGLLVDRSEVKQVGFQINIGGLDE